MKPSQAVAGNEKWVRLGFLIAIGYALFTVVLVYLLRFDLLIGLVVGVVISGVGGALLLVYIQFFFDTDEE